MQQFEVIKGITLAMARTLETQLREAFGRDIPVRFRYADVKGECLTLCHAGVVRRAGNVDREYELRGGAEQFRNPPMLLRAQYFVSAWAEPPEDQAILGAILRTFLDRPHLEIEGEDEEEMIAYAGIPEVCLDTITLEEHRDLAQGFGMPFAPSVAYCVDFRLQSGKVTPIKRVKERVMDFKKIEG